MMIKRVQLHFPLRRRRNIWAGFVGKIMILKKWLERLFLTLVDSDIFTFCVFMHKHRHTSLRVPFIYYLFVIVVVSFWLDKLDSFDRPFIILESQTEPNLPFFLSVFEYVNYFFSKSKVVLQHVAHKLFVSTFFFLLRTWQCFTFQHSRPGLGKLWPGCQMWPVGVCNPAG